MPVLEVSLPLDPLLSSSSWAWLIAVFVATIATFSRFSLFSFFMDRKPISSFIFSRHARPCDHLSMEVNTSSESELNASTPHEALCVDQEGSKKGDSRSFLHHRCTEEEGSEAAEDGNEAEEEIEVIPSWVSSLLEASRFRVEASIPALEATRACISCFQARTWSQSLHRKISTRVGTPWHYMGTHVGVPLQHQVALPRLAQCQNVSKGWSCQQLQVLELLQFLNMQSTISAVKMGTHDGFEHVGYRSGKIALWDVEKRFCLSSLCIRRSLVTALFVTPYYPRVAIAAGPHTLYQNSSVVSFWDDRCASHGTNYILSTSANCATALGCEAHEFGIAGGRYVSMYDFRMLKGSPILLYSIQTKEKMVWGERGSKERGPYYEDNEVNNAHKVMEEADECGVINKMVLPSTYDLEGSHASSKGSFSSIINCLSFMCCLGQHSSSL